MSESSPLYDALVSTVSEASRSVTADLAADLLDLLARVEALEQRAIDAQRWPEWMRLSEAAAYCGVSPDWLSERARHGEVPSWHPTGEAHRRFNRADLDALMRGDLRRSAA